MTVAVDEGNISSDTAGQAFDFGDPYADVPELGRSPADSDTDRKLDDSLTASRLAEKKETAAGKPDRARAGPPTLDEWQDFFSRIVLLTLAEWYVSFAFRGVPDDLVSDEDLARCQLSKEDRQAISIPFAEFANKSEIARKRGRQVIALMESMEAVLILGLYMNRVNKIARKYRPQKAKRGRNVDQGQVPPTANGGKPEFIPDESIRIYNPGTG